MVSFGAGLDMVVFRFVHLGLFLLHGSNQEQAIEEIAIYIIHAFRYKIFITTPMNLSVTAFAASRNNVRTTEELHPAMKVNTASKIPYPPS